MEMTAVVWNSSVWPVRKGRKMNIRAWRLLVAALVAALALAGCGSKTSSDGASSGGWAPNKDIDWIVPYSPGGGFDVYSRGIAEVMQKTKLPNGVNVVIRNMPPLPQGITQEYTAKPDGYTIGILPMPAAIAQQIQDPDLAKWDTEKFTVLGSVDENAYVVYVAANSPYHSIDDLIGKKGLRSLTVEEGSSSALAGLATIRSLGLDAKMTYGAEGSADVVTGLIRGDADFIVYGSTDLTGFVESGDIKPLLFLGTEDQRPESLTWLKDVPSAQSKGFKDLGGAVTELRLIVAPPNMPDNIATYLRDAVYGTMTSQQFADWAKTAKRPIIPRDWKAATEVMNKQVEQMKELVPTLSS
jgi:tripartite-type tricarboxylate transporter receptor subunit TctC